MAIILDGVIQYGLFTENSYDEIFFYLQTAGLQLPLKRTLLALKAGNGGVS